MTKCRLLTLLLFFFFLFNTNANAQNILWQQTTIPMTEAGSHGLETLLVWPDTPGKHPLALLSHGSPRDPKQRPSMTAISYLPIAMEFARRGFAVALVLRRGYGSSGGGWAESNGSCDATTYKQAAFAASKDLHAAITYLSTLPQFDTDRMIAVGVSAGGFATVALTADSPPKGLVAAISFAGGRGSRSNDFVCQQDSLVSTFGLLGKTSRIPMLWIYADNDHFFNPDIAQKFYKAFTDNGGNVTFIHAPAYGKEGHFLFSTAGIPTWTPIVDDFLKQQHLVLVSQLIPLPPIPSLNPPPQLSAKNKKVFATYLTAPPHKAFAVSANGAFGWSSGRRTVDEARKVALAYCEKFATRPCELYNSR